MLKYPWFISAKRLWQLSLIVCLLAGCGEQAWQAHGDSSRNVRVIEAYKQHESDIWCTASGVVTRLLDDDIQGTRHQRFILRLTNGQTILVVHNLDIAPRVPVTIGDHLVVSGQYEWNAKGGLMHWTHHDPAGKITGGWIECSGKKYY